MNKATVAVACILLFATGVNAKSVKPSVQEQGANGWPACEAELQRAAQSAKDAATITVDADGVEHSRKPTGKFVPHDHSKCEQWETYYQKTYGTPGN